MFWIKFIREIRLFLGFRKIALKNSELLEKNNLRVSNLGVVYTVFNVPSEIATAPEQAQQGWVFSQLKNVTDVMTKIGLAEDAYPELEKIEDKDTNAILVKIYPIYETFNFLKLIWNLILTSGLFYLILLTANNWEWIYLNILKIADGLLK